MTNWVFVPYTLKNSNITLFVPDPIRPKYFPIEVVPEEKIIDIKKSVAYSNIERKATV